MGIHRFILLFCCTGFLAGMTCCGQKGVQELGFGGYWYVLPVPKKEFERVGDHGLVWKCNGWELLVDKNEQIHLDGKKYGKMNKGDELSVSWEGEIFLNKKEIFPIKDEDSDE